MNNLTVLIPIHEIREGYDNFIINALNSVENQLVKPKEIRIITTKEAFSAVGKITDSHEGTVPLSISVNEGDSDFCSQINFGVEEIDTEWFCILEFDDELSNIYFKNAKEYIESYSEVSAFLPIVMDVDPSNNFIGFTNQPVWAHQFSSDLGFLDMDSLMKYQNFSIDGIIMKTEEFKRVNGLKSNMKLTFPYEFLLRSSNNGVQIMVIPKFGYKHTNHREHSLFFNYAQEVTMDESKFWLNKAQKEYMFTDDRDITYEPIMPVNA